MQGLTEAEVMAAKGYSEKDVIQADVQKAYAEGIGKMGSNMGGGSGGGGGNSILGDVMGLGIGMAAAQAVVPQMGNMFSGMNPNQNNAPANETAPASQSTSVGWDCPACGAKNIQSKFCPESGGKKPEPKLENGWDSPNCGCKNITSKFCPDCGEKDIMSKFCPNCGRKKDE